jgi:uncharacterized protein YeeX (DUF496 family)
MSDLHAMSAESISIETIAQIYAENELDELCSNYKDIREFNSREDARNAMLDALKELFKKSVHNLDWDKILEEMRHDYEIQQITESRKEMYARGEYELEEGEIIE